MFDWRRFSAAEGASMRFTSFARRVWNAGVLIVSFAATGRSQTTSDDLLAWGLEVYAETVASLKVSDSDLFAETASLGGKQSGGNGGFAYLWPLTTQFRVQIALARLDATAYAPLLRPFSDEMHARYWHAGGGYRSGVGDDATLFYDDNAHVVVALMEAHRLTGDPVLLSRAEETQKFVLSGEDSAGGGGVYFSQPDRTAKDAISTLQGARGAAMLYRATDRESYLDDARRLSKWAGSHVRRADGIFLERYYLSGEKCGTAGDFALVNAAGVAILLNLELYAETDELQKLEEAQQIARHSLALFCHAPTGAIYDEGYWAFEFVDALCELSRADGDPHWRNQAVRALSWLHDNRRDPNGRYGPLWGRGGLQRDELSEWHVNDNAAVARAYLQAAHVAAPVSGLLDHGVVDAEERAP